mmetsp:Transcript_82921/g.173622  ORF Transcript_82921/g.173622 Transcript_82921/m.173622 type:complete len:84 (-) Transcript_82921:6-257(-)
MRIVGLGLKWELRGFGTSEGHSGFEVPRRKAFCVLSSEELPARLSAFGRGDKKLQTPQTNWCKLKVREEFDGADAQPLLRENR